MGEYSYILEQQGKTTSEKLAEFTAAIGWRDELATYRIAQDEYENLPHTMTHSRQTT